MWEYQNTDELYHFGILGMKWGHRKARNKGTEKNKISRSEKLKNIRNMHKNNKKYKYSGDLYRINYLSETPIKRVGNVLSCNIVKRVINSVLDGTFGYDIFRKSYKTLMGTALDTIVYDAISESTMKRFNDDGTYKQNKETKTLNKETSILAGYEIAKAVGAGVAKAKGIYI